MEKTHGYKTYWITWFVLLALTLGMLAIDDGPFPKLMVLAVLLAAMAVKASAIGAYFMHLRLERPRLVLAVVAGLALTGAVLFGVIAFDARHILRVSCR